MKKVIVTGGSGFIGSNLVKFLLKKKYFVINIDNSSYSANPYNLIEIKKNRSYKYYKLDINNKDKGKRSNEKFPYNPSSPYSASKASADHLIKSYIRTFKIPGIISNCCNNYGPNQFPEKFIPKLIYNIIKKKPLPIYGRGKNSREWIHVQDHCEALLKIFLKGKIGESYNIGTNQDIKNIDLAKKLLLMTKSKVTIKYVKDRPGHDFRYALNSQKIRKQLKWKAKINLNKGLKDTFYWYLNNTKFFKSVSKKLYDKRLGLKND